MLQSSQMITPVLSTGQVLTSMLSSSQMIIPNERRISVSSQTIAAMLSSSHMTTSVFLSTQIFTSVFSFTQMITQSVFGNVLIQHDDNISVIIQPLISHGMGKVIIQSDYHVAVSMGLANSIDIIIQLGDNILLVSARMTTQWFPLALSSGWVITMSITQLLSSGWVIMSFMFSYSWMITFVLICGISKTDGNIDVFIWLDGNILHQIWRYHLSV